MKRTIDNIMIFAAAAVFSFLIVAGIALAITQFGVPLPIALVLTLVAILVIYFGVRAYVKE